MLNPVTLNSGEMIAVAASQTGFVLGISAGIGDYVSHVIINPASTSPGNVILIDGAMSYTLFPGGSTSVADQAPIVIPVQCCSVFGAWKITTGANVSVLAVGIFSGGGVRLFDFMGGVLPSDATLTRASTGWYFNSSLALASAPTDAARFNYDPTTAALQGLLVEPAATNSIRNSSANGAVPGTPGTLPTNWSVSGSPSGITQQIVRIGTESGIAYIDIRFFGTPASSGSASILPEPISATAAINGQTWIFLSYLRVSAGSLTGVSDIRNFWAVRDSGSVQLNNFGGTILASLGSNPLATQLFSVVGTIANPAAAFVNSLYSVSFAAAVPVDFTLRIGLPNFVRASAATSPIVTTSAAVTRAADVLSLALANGTYSMDIVRAAGTTTLSGVTVSGNRYTVPTDPSPLQRVIARRTA